MEYEPQEHELSAAIDAAELEMKDVVVADWRNDVVDIQKPFAAYGRDDLTVREVKLLDELWRRDQLVGDLEVWINLFACLVLGLSALITVFIWRIS